MIAAPAPTPILRPITLAQVRKLADFVMTRETNKIKATYTLPSCSKTTRYNGQCTFTIKAPGQPCSKIKPAYAGILYLRVIKSGSKVQYRLVPKACVA